MTTTEIDGRRQRGSRARAGILEAAVDLATTAGLDGLSLSQLAKRLNVSKSGLFAHWSSKQELQLDAIAFARDQWVDHVIRPALSQPKGIRRLWALHEARLDFYASGTLTGGCFFAHTEFEHSTREGPVKEQLAEANAAWYGLVERLVRESIEAGELSDEVPVAQLAYEIDAFGVSCVLYTRLMNHDSAQIYSQARSAVLQRLQAASPAPQLLPQK